MKRIYVLFLLIVLLALPSVGLAQSYYFQLDQLTVDVFMNGDGTVDLLYSFTFTNLPGSSPIEFVDVGLPNNRFEEYLITAEVDGEPVAYVSSSEYEGDGTGVAVALGGAAIQPGQTGTVRVYIPGVERMFYPDDQDGNYASLRFAPTYFGSAYVEGNTDVSVTFHLPPGVLPEEPRWHNAPPGWAREPETGFDEQGRITYTWRNSNATGYLEYQFGASVPRQYLPAGAVVRPSLLERLGISGDDLIFGLVCVGFATIFFGSTAWGIFSERRRRMQYLPPKISVEGHGIKRGLTAIEAAILMEQPMDKILTMILFAVIKKEAASVKSRDPLELEIAAKLPDELRPYETDFLDAFRVTKPAERKAALQNTMISLVRGVTNKMKGFSRKESIEYYRQITESAWGQVEAAGTPEVKSAKYDEVMEWTMLDRDYDDRTRRTFSSGPVFVPSWWGRYQPGFPSSSGSSGGGSVSLPNLPGSDFAASMVNSVQSFSGGVIGGISEFTSGVTNKTNPPPVSSSRGGSRSGGGGGCACACACAGCACACAGGGR
jgi:hypothetical protein